MSKKDFEKIYQLHCSEDIVNVQLALVLIKPRMTNYSRWLANKILTEITLANDDMINYNFSNNDRDAYDDCIRVIGFISRDEDISFDYSYILRLFRHNKCLDFSVDNSFWKFIFKSNNEQDLITLKLKHINRLLIDMNHANLHEPLFQLFKCILTKEIYGRFKSY